MSWLIWVVLYLIMVSEMIRQIRERRRRGIKFEWSKGLATCRRLHPGRDRRLRRADRLHGDRPA